MSTSHFPDVNVWVALAHEIHPHCEVARNWFAKLPPADDINFCRFTQMGLLRLLTNRAAMGEEDQMSQLQAWKAFDRLIALRRIQLVDEPLRLEPSFRALTQGRSPGTKDWADAYLASFAATAGFSLVTFDRTLAKRTPGAVLLQV